VDKCTPCNQLCHILDCFECASYSCAAEHRDESKNCAKFGRKYPSLPCPGESCYNDMCISALRDTELFSSLHGKVTQAEKLRIGKPEIAKPETSTGNNSSIALFGEQNKQLILSCLDSVRSSVRPPARVSKRFLRGVLKEFLTQNVRSFNTHF